MNLAEIQSGQVVRHLGEWRWSGLTVDGGLLDGRLDAVDVADAKRVLELLFHDLARPQVQLVWHERGDDLEFEVQASALDAHAH